MIFGYIIITTIIIIIIIQRKLLSDITIRRIQQEALNLLNGNQNNEAENINITDNTNATLNKSTNHVEKRSEN